jgi:hypothetical protein
LQPTISKKYGYCCPDTALERGKGFSQYQQKTNWILTKFHRRQIPENSAKKLKYSGSKKLFTAENWSGTLAEITE